MRKEVFYLGTCNSCKRIMKTVKVDSSFKRQDVKTEAITADQIDEMKDMAGSYEALFSKIARKYRSLGLKEKNLEEKDFRAYILEEYTFLKRPVFILGEEIFVGNSSKTVESITQALEAAR